MIKFCTFPYAAKDNYIHLVSDTMRMPFSPRVYAQIWQTGVQNWRWRRWYGAATVTQSSKNPSHPHRATVLQACSCFLICAADGPFCGFCADSSIAHEDQDKQNKWQVHRDVEAGRQRLSCVGFLQVCVGAEAEDNFHMVEIEGLTYDGKSTKVPLAVLKPSIMPSVSAHDEGYSFIMFSRFSGQKENQYDIIVALNHCSCCCFLDQMSLGGFEIMPPVTFRLQAGSGPVHISGQHFISEYFPFYTCGARVKHFRLYLLCSFTNHPLLCRSERCWSRGGGEQHVTSEATTKSDVWEEVGIGVFLFSLGCRSAFSAERKLQLLQEICVKKVIFLLLSCL